MTRDNTSPHFPFSIVNFQFIPLVFLLVTVGCSGTNWMKKPNFSALLPPGPPAKVLAVWEPAVKHEAGGEKAQRGFGGRVYFHDQDAKRPIKVDGNVVVYAFDEEGRQVGDNVPTRTYFFERDDVKKLYSKSKLGHSYNFWIPWDADGPDGQARKVSLIVRYVPKVGSSVVSSQAVAYLPGKRGQSEMTAQVEWERRNKLDATVRQVANRGSDGRFVDGMRHADGTIKEKGLSTEERLIETNDSRPTAMQTATICLPNSVSRGMVAAMSGPSPVPEIQPVNYLQEAVVEKPVEPQKLEAGPEREKRALFDRNLPERKPLFIRDGTLKMSE